MFFFGLMSLDVPAGKMNFMECAFWKELKLNRLCLSMSLNATLCV